MIVYTIVFIAVAISTWQRTALALPILVVLDPFDMASYVGHTTLTTFKVALVAIGTVLIIRRFAQTPERSVETWTLLSLALLFIATGATIPEATMRSAAVRETLKVFEYGVIFFLSACVARVDSRSEHYLRIAVVGTIAIVGVVALQDYWHPQSGIWIHGNAFVRIAGPLDGPNQFAAWLGIVLPILLTAATSITTVTFTFGCAILALTLSRGGAVQALVAFIGTASISPTNVRRPLIAGIIAFTFALGCFAIASRSTEAAAHSVSIQSSVDEGGTGSREILWRSALKMFREHPFLGVGAGNFEFRLPAYGAPPQVRTQANSLYLEALADGGLILCVITIVVALLPPTLMLTTSQSTYVRIIGVIGLALAIHGLIDDVTFYTKVGQCWWLFAGVAAGVDARHENHSIDQQ